MVGNVASGFVGGGNQRIHHGRVHRLEALVRDRDHTGGTNEDYLGPVLA